MNVAAPKFGTVYKTDIMVPNAERRSLSLLSLMLEQTAIVMDKQAGRFDPAEDHENAVFSLVEVDDETHEAKSATVFTLKHAKAIMQRYYERIGKPEWFVQMWDELLAKTTNAPIAPEDDDQMAIAHAVVDEVTDEAEKAGEKIEMPVGMGVFKLGIRRKD